MFYNMLGYEAYGYAIVKVYLLPGIKKGGLPSVCGMSSFLDGCLLSSYRRKSAIILSIVSTI